jgi:hypothetical protein
MRSCFLRSGFVAAALLATSCQSGGNATSGAAAGPRPARPCGGLDAEGRELHDKLIHVATASDSSAIRTRATVHLQPMPADSVLLVNEPEICERALATIVRFRGPAGPEYQTINVFRLGPVYVVNRPDGHGSLDVWVLDQTFKILMGWGI